MNLDAELQGIVRENEGDLLVFARKLYEHGYRQGLAARPQALVEPAPAPPAPVVPAPAPHGPLFPSRPKLIAVPEEDADEPEGEDVRADEEEATTCDHRVRGSITIAGLQKKIERMFDLSRFDIDVVICRRGDPERRRLKGGVKLKNYLIEAE
jgi:hypothetical protein